MTLTGGTSITLGGSFATYGNGDLGSRGRPVDLGLRCSLNGDIPNKKESRVCSMKRHPNPDFSVVQGNKYIFIYTHSVTQ